MSFILDALKKSEVERQRQAIPGLMDSRPLPRRTKFPLWAAALIALLAINLVILAAVLTRSALIGSAGSSSPAAAPASAQAPAPTASPAASKAAPAATSQAVAATAAMPPAAAGAPPSGASAPASTAPDHFSPMDAAAPVYAPEIPPTQDYATSGGAHRAARGGSSSDATTHSAPRVPDPVLSDSSDPSDNEVLPSINEINVAGRPALADLHIDVHVYATKPSERFVYINMRKYKEGATLAEGPVLERIRRDGVVLNYQGMRFVLPRQQ
jgi:general secretion pathway protein B